MEPHGPEAYASRFMAPLPIRHQHGEEHFLSNRLLRLEMNEVYQFAQYLRSELDGAHYLADGRHAVVMNELHQLSVLCATLKSDQEHLINDHLIPLQRFANGILDGLAVLTGEDYPGRRPSPSAGGGRPSSSIPSSSPLVPRPTYPTPVGLTSLDLRAFGLDASDYADESCVVDRPSSVPSLESVSSSSEEEPLLHSSPSSCSSFLGKWPSDMKWGDLPAYIAMSDSLYFRREEAFISQGESGEPEAVRPTEGDASGSGSEVEDGGPSVLAEEAGGARNSSDAGGV